MNASTGNDAKVFDQWQNFILKGQAKGVRNTIVDSWKRCQNLKLDPINDAPSSQNNKELLQKRNEQYDVLSNLLQNHNQDITDKCHLLPFVAVYIDTGGYIQSISGHEHIMKLSEETNLMAGSSINEEDAGTTAPALALMTGHSSYVYAEEHYFKALHWASCFAIPVKNTYENIVGCLNFATSSDFEGKLNQLLPFFENIANSVQLEYILKEHLETSDLHRAYFQATFDYAQDILLLVDKHGKIIRTNLTAQKTLGLKQNTLMKYFAQHLLYGGQSQNLPLELNKTQKVKLWSPSKGGSQPYALESVPLFNQEGEKIAFLLKLERQKNYINCFNKTSYPTKFSFENIIGRSNKINNLVKRAQKVAQFPSYVLIEGETGTGKELLAHSIHAESQYSDGPFIALNCSAIPDQLIESEFFGYEKGAYTGAKKDGDIGKFELADKGTLFLDEIQAMSLPAQQKLLRVLEEKQITRLGGKQNISLDFRIIAASSQSLENEIENGNFIQALFFRLNVVRLCMPSLRERKEDIPLLVNYFIRIMNQKFNKNIQGVTSEVLNRFQNYSWIGNVRELENCIESAFNFCETELISLDDLEDKLLVESESETEQDKGIEEITKKLMIESLQKYDKIKDAAHSLGISTSTFYRKRQKFGI